MREAPNPGLNGDLMYTGVDVPAAGLPGRIGEHHVGGRPGDRVPAQERRAWATRWRSTAIDGHNEAERSSGRRNQARRCEGHAASWSPWAGGTAAGWGTCPTHDFRRSHLHHERS